MELCYLCDVQYNRLDCGEIIATSTFSFLCFVGAFCDHIRGLYDLGLIGTLQEEIVEL